MRKLGLAFGISLFIPKRQTTPKVSLETVERQGRYVPIPAAENPVAHGWNQHRSWSRSLPRSLLLSDRKSRWIKTVAQVLDRFVFLYQAQLSGRSSA